MKFFIAFALFFTAVAAGMKQEWRAGDPGPKTAIFPVEYYPEAYYQASRMRLYPDAIFGGEAREMKLKYQFPNVKAVYDPENYYESHGYYPE
jgi:hypothetical protein